MHKLIMLWLIGAAVLTLSPSYPASAQPTDEDVMGPQARIAQIQAILDEEDEGLADDDDLDSDQQEPDSQGDTEDDFEDQDDPEDATGEMGSSGEWGTPT
jgi:hypothetical protein